MLHNTRSQSRPANCNNSPPSFNRDEKSPGGGQIAQTVPIGDGLRARVGRILTYMREQTPRGAAKPWRSKANRAAILEVLQGGTSENELRELIDGGAELVARGDQAARWWYPRNLFCEPTCSIWLGQVAEFRLRQELAQARTEQIAQNELARRAEAQASPPPRVQSLGLARITAQAREALVERIELERDESAG